MQFAAELIPQWRLTFDVDGNVVLEDRAARQDFIDIEEGDRRIVVIDFAGGVFQFAGSAKTTPALILRRVALT